MSVKSVTVLQSDRAFSAVAPTDVAGEHNLIRTPFRPFAMWELADAHFAFDSSILLPSMTGELAELVRLIRANEGALLAVFGHTDVTGNDDYNKTLSGRRAQALYALLTRRVDLWSQLDATAHGGDDWRRDDQALAIMRAHLGLAPDAPAPRADLFERYMAALARDESGKSFGLPKSAFLGRGADQHGKGDFQGCGEFNPVVMLSAAQQRELSGAGAKAARDEAGGPNRRVTVFLFHSETRIELARWPCPRAREGPAACRARFWSDAPRRRQAHDARREYPRDADTFACRFYDRLAEALGPRQAARLTLRLVSSTGEPLADADYRLEVAGAIATGKTDGRGIVHATVPASATDAVLRVAGWTIELTITDLAAASEAAGARARLRNLGFPDLPPAAVAAGEAAASSSGLLEVALFQEHHDLAPSGTLDPPTVAKLVEIHGS